MALAAHDTESRAPPPTSVELGDTSSWQREQAEIIKQYLSEVDDWTAGIERVSRRRRGSVTEIPDFSIWDADEQCKPAFVSSDMSLATSPPTTPPSSQTSQEIQEARKAALNHALELEPEPEPEPEAKPQVTGHPTRAGAGNTYLFDGIVAAVRGNARSDRFKFLQQVIHPGPLGPTGAAMLFGRACIHNLYRSSGWFTD